MITDDELKILIESEFKPMPFKPNSYTYKEAVVLYIFWGFSAMLGIHLSLIETLNVNEQRNADA